MNSFVPWSREVFLADLHIHSRYSRATSPRMGVEELNRAAKAKGIGLVGTGDFTHPDYLDELEEALVQVDGGFYVPMDDPDGTRFVFTAEVANIFTQGGRNRRIHTVLIAPDLETAREIQARLASIGNVSSDGRPIFGFPVKNLVRIAREANPDTVVIPAHIWTPWFSLFGAKSGFDSIEECFEEESRHIHALETGLSSDPPMNWRLSALDGYTLVSNSDAHSPSKLGREANVFSCPMTFDDMAAAIREPSRGFEGTVEFFPEEGKYHLDGHRDCGVWMTPEESSRAGGMCPRCGRPLTVGVLHRVYDLADRPDGARPATALPCVHLIPLEEVLAQVMGVKSITARVKKEYDRLIALAGNEFDILMWRPLADLAQILPPRVFHAIRNMRAGNVEIRPGHDGLYGVIDLSCVQTNQEGDEGRDDEGRQMDLF